MNCRGICCRFEGYESQIKGWFKEGKKYCAECKYKIKTNNIRCYCCKGVYRIRVRGTTAKKIIDLRARIE